MILLHIGAFQWDVDSRHPTPWHQLTPQTRILCVLLGVLAIALTPNGHWITWGIYAVGIFGLILLSRITWPVLLKRLAVESAFVGVVLLGTLFREGGTVLWQWGWLKITTTGLMILGSVTLKALLSLTLLNLLTLTTSISDLLQGLTVLKMPPLLVSMMAAMYRYLGVLVGEMQAMRRAALSRNLLNGKHWQRLVVGNMIGALFIRTVDRGDRIHQAMLARGYRGLPPTRPLPNGGRADIAALTFTAAWALLGQALPWLSGF